MFEAALELDSQRLTPPSLLLVSAVLAGAHTVRCLQAPLGPIATIRTQEVQRNERRPAVGQNDLIAVALLQMGSFADRWNAVLVPPIESLPPPR